MTGSLGSGRRRSNDGGLIVADDLLPALVPILEAAVREYGPVSWQEWPIVGVAICGENASAREIEGQSRLLVAIVLPETAGTDPAIAQAFLAHEAVHCMHLKKGHLAPMIEEGCAVRFSLIEVARLGTGYAATLREHQTTAPGLEHYAAALAAVEHLLSLSPDAIRTLRAADPDWGAITPERILAVAPALPAEVAAVLCEVRDMSEPWRAAQAEAEREERE